MILGLALTLLLHAAVQGEEGRAPSPTGFRLPASNGYDFFAWAGALVTGDKGRIALALTRGSRAVAGCTADDLIMRGLQPPTAGAVAAALQARLTELASGVWGATSEGPPR